MEANVDPPSRGSRLDADHPLNGVLIPCRFTGLGLEGSDWLIEGRRKSTFRAVSRWSRRGALRDLEEPFFELARPPLTEIEDLLIRLARPPLTEIEDLLIRLCRDRRKI
jgi:hypothetical protein